MIGPVVAARPGSLTFTYGTSQRRSPTVPTQQEFQLQLGIFRTLLLERMRLPLQVTGQVAHDPLESRAMPTERNLGEDMPRSNSNYRTAKLRDVNISVSAKDKDPSKWLPPSGRTRSTSR